MKTTILGSDNQTEEQFLAQFSGNGETEGFEDNLTLEEACELAEELGLSCKLYRYSEDYESDSELLVYKIDESGNWRAL
jgi:hypothetical protein